MKWQRKTLAIHETLLKRWSPYCEEDQRFLALALAGEVGEFCNVVKKVWRGDFEISKVHEQIEEELADIRIYLELAARSFDVDLDEACEKKMPELERRWPDTAAAIAALGDA